MSVTKTLCDIEHICFMTLTPLYQTTVSWRFLLEPGRQRRNVTRRNKLKYIPLDFSSIHIPYECYIIRFKLPNNKAASADKTFIILKFNM